MTARLTRRRAARVSDGKEARATEHAAEDRWTIKRRAKRGRSAVDVVPQQPRRSARARVIAHRERHGGELYAITGLVGRRGFHYDAKDPGHAADPKLKEARFSYRVRYQGYPPSADTWTPDVHLKEWCPAAIKLYEQLPGRHDQTVEFDDGDDDDDDDAENDEDSSDDEWVCPVLCVVCHTVFCP